MGHPVSIIPPHKTRRVRLRKVLNLRLHYEYKGMAKRFYNVRDWNKHRDWIIAGERWLKKGLN